MAKTVTYLVSFNPADRTENGHRISFRIGEPNVDHEVHASSFLELERVVRKLAREFGRSCSPYIRLKDRKERSPNGFKAWDAKMTFIEFVPTEEKENV